MENEELLWCFADYLELRLLDYFMINQFVCCLEKMRLVKLDRDHCFITSNAKAYINRLWNCLPDIFLTDFMFINSMN